MVFFVCQFQQKWCDHRTHLKGVAKVPVSFNNNSVVSVPNSHSKRDAANVPVSFSSDGVASLPVITMVIVKEVWPLFSHSN